MNSRFTLDTHIIRIVLAIALACLIGGLNLLRADRSPLMPKKHKHSQVDAAGDVAHIHELYVSY